MSANGLEVFDKTIQTTNIWLKEIMEEVGPDRQVAWKVLSVVLHKLRARLPVEVSAHLGSQLPMLVRGVYYDQYQPAKQPGACRDYEEFVAEVDDWLSDIRPTDPKVAVRAVFDVLSRHIPAPQIDKVKASLPEKLRSAWTAPAPRRASAEDEQGAGAPA